MVAEVDNYSSDDAIQVMVGQGLAGVCLAAISNAGQLGIMALVMVTNLVRLDPSNDMVGWAGGSNVH